MSATESIERVTAILAAFNRNDIDAIGEMVSPDLVYIVRGRASISGTHNGWRAMAGVLNQVKDLTNGTITGTPEVVLADENTELMYARFAGSRPDGRTYDSHQAYRYRLKDGLVIEGETIPVDQNAFAEFLV